MQKSTTFTGLVTKNGLDASDIIQVQALADAVRDTDGIGLKLNLPRQRWQEPTTQAAPQFASDLCWYDTGRLVGYAPLDGDEAELEVTAAVMPAYRGRGIFRMLLDAAQQEALRHGIGRLLLVSYPGSASGVAAVHSLGLPYAFSEYRLEVEASGLPLLDTGCIRLIPVNKTNLTDLVQLTARSFGSTSRPADAIRADHAAPGSRYFLAEVQGEYIGQIGVVDVGESIYLRGFGIVPERRRCGYGHQLLATMLQAMLAEQHEHFALDVAADNRHALLLYEVCGFREKEAYDYYRVPITETST